MTDFVKQRLTQMIGWGKFNFDCKALARWCRVQSQHRKEGPFDRIIGIARGGLIPAAILAHELDIRIVQSIGMYPYDEGVQPIPPAGSNVIGMYSYDDGARTKSHSTVLFECPSVYKGGETTLVVDDIVDSGASIRAVREFMPKAIFVAVYAKPKCRELIVPHQFADQIDNDTWVVFPWERGP